jgi:preprotein translocase subunit YajC
VLGATSGGAASLEGRIKLVVPGGRFYHIATVIRTLVGREPAAILLPGGRRKGATKVTFANMEFRTFAFAWQAPGALGGLGMFLPLILIMVIFYFLMILPAQKRQKKITDLLKDLKNGDKVITNGGIYGTIVGLEDDAVQLRIADNVKMKVARNAIAGLQAEPPKENS